MLSPMRPGDIVDIVAPASQCTVQELKNGLRAIEALGLIPRVPAKLFAPSRLFSNSDENRLKHFRDAIYSSDSKMVWCVRGGYGSLRLVPELMKWRRPRQKKIFLGYSDITTLHLFLNQKWGWSTLHGQMVERFGGQKMQNPERRELANLLFGQRSSLEFQKLEPLNAAARRSARLRGRICGGNLAVVVSSFGTPAEFGPPGDLIFLEDIGERPHRVDRMLTQMLQAGKFNKAKAILFGYFMLTESKDRRDLWQDVIPRFAQSLKIPVLRGLPVGHNWDRQAPLPFMTGATLTTGRVCRLVVESGIETYEHL